MTERGAIIEETLRRLADLEGDPQAVIYARLFEKRPDFEDMFVMDRDGGVRASMLQACFTCIFGLAEGSNITRQQLEAARLHHDGYGLSGADLDLIFEIIRDHCREVLADDWTKERDAAWASLLGEMSALNREAAEPC